MEHSKDFGYVEASETEQSIMHEALHNDGRPDCASALQGRGNRPIPEGPVHFIMESVRKLAQSGERPDAQAVVDSFDQLVVDF